METRNDKTKWLYDSLGVMLALFIVSGLAYLFMRNDDGDELQQNTISHSLIDVHAAIVSQGELTEYVTLNGITQFLKQGSIRSQNTGYVQTLKYGINQYIRKGDLFCNLRTKEQEALRNVKTSATFSNFQKPLVIKSNATGLITALYVHNGDYVSEGEVLALIKEPASLVLVVNVPFEYNQRVRVGTPCELSFSDGRKMNLAITGVLPTVEATSQTQSYYISMPDKKLPENLIVSIRLMLNRSLHTSITVPVEALQTDELEQDFWVMRIHGGVAFKVPVMPGIRSNGQVEIKSGSLQAGDSIVTAGSYQLDDSTMIQIIQ